MVISVRPEEEFPMEIMALSALDDDNLDLVGGKAVGLGKLINSGERVPDGFCVTTEAYRRDRIPADAVIAAYRRLGGGAVAVRSSATAEDLPDASFAGVQETVLGVTGDEALLAAIRTCWESLQSPRAIAYREARGHGTTPAAMAVVVQRMIDPVAAGVTFTANPITGTRAQLVIDAAPGLGTRVVDGAENTDHYELRDGDRPSAHGCLSLSQLEELRRVGRRIERDLGGPQDLEWAFDRDGTLWQLQARPITTLFPVPDDDGRGLRVFLEVGHMQGLRGPVTPMGMSVLTRAGDHWLEAYGLPDTRDAMVTIAGRLFLDVTFMFRDRRFRPRIPAMLEIYGPGVAAAATRLLDDPRLAVDPGRPLPVKTIMKVAAKIVPDLLTGSVSAMIMPGRARRRAFRLRDQVRAAAPPEETATTDAASRIAVAAAAQDPVLMGPMTELLPPLYAGLSSSRIAAGLLGPVAEPGEIDATQRGMPYNVTTEMDLELWRVAQAARAHRDLFLDTAPDELARRFRAGRLPDVGLDRFLESYGHRGAAEIDVGVACWAEDPTPLFAAIGGYLQVDDPEQGPDRRFARARAEAERTLDLLVGRAMRTRPLRGAVAGWLLRRSRDLAGLRELPKFVWLLPLQTVRRQLGAAGAELAAQGRLRAPGDIWYLTLDEAAAAAAGTDQSSLAAGRRADHLREQRRIRVPGVLLSDGTMPENLRTEVRPDDHTLVGMPAAAGTVTGVARVIHDPAKARLAPGEILVAATTDPGWTPLFLTAGGLVTETGSPVAHGPTVAREYGIPAVICVPDATTRLDGRTVTVDGNSGTVRLVD